MGGFQSGRRLGPGWAQTEPNLGPDWAQAGPELGPEWAETGPRLGVPKKKTKIFTKQKKQRKKGSPINLDRKFRGESVGDGPGAEFPSKLCDNMYIK